MNEIDLSGKNFSSHERVLIFRLKLLGGLATQSAMHEQVYFYTHSDHFRPIVRWSFCFQCQVDLNLDANNHHAKKMFHSPESKKHSNRLNE